MEAAGTVQKLPWCWARNAGSDDGRASRDGEKWANVRWESWTGYRGVKKETRNEGPLTRFLA